jgi:hypothetical protein
LWLAVAPGMDQLARFIGGSGIADRPAMTPQAGPTDIFTAWAPQYPPTASAALASRRAGPGG